jgi:hypothetical protein
MSTPLVLPTEIRWETLKSKELEEALYWLIDSLGGKDLEWRLGGAGQGAADGGRDLEATFFSNEVDGELVPQVWWIEAKGRKKTLEIGAVQQAIRNASERVDVLVITTNTTFSNPTRDWVKDWQKSHPRPRVRLWDRYQLEKLFCQHPDVVARLYPNALSVAGQLEALRSRFWNYAAYGTVATLKNIWRHRDTIEWTSQTHLAVIASEIAHGDLRKRAWGTTIDPDDLLDVLAVGLFNVPAFVVRATGAGADDQPFLRTNAYLLLSMLYWFPSAYVATALEMIWDHAPGNVTFPDHIRHAILEPVLGTLVAELRDVCTSDCVRVSTSPVLLAPVDIKSYWNRFVERDEPDEERPRGKVLMMESFEAACKAGLELDHERTCPIIAVGGDDEGRDLATIFASLQAVIHGRIGRPDTNATEDS